MYDPNNIVLTTVGLQYLRDRRDSGLPARIGGYRLGDSNIFIPSESNTDIFGNETYRAAVDEIFYVVYSENEVIFRCCCENTKGDFDIGNIGIYADTGTLLFISKFPYIHRKMKTTANDSDAGGRWTFQVRLLQENIQSFWDFSNLTLKYATMNVNILADVEAPRYPLDSFYSELHLNDSFRPTNRGGYFNISGDISRKWYCSPFMQSDAYTTVYNIFDLRGGIVGDFHQTLE